MWRVAGQPGALGENRNSSARMATNHSYSAFILQPALLLLLRELDGQHKCWSYLADYCSRMMSLYLTYAETRGSSRNKITESLPRDAHIQP
jgi:hypothetical protein